MRTTVDIEGPLLREARKKAAQSETTLSRLVSEALRSYLRQFQAPPADPPFRLITAGTTTGPAPTPQQIRRTLDEEDAAALRIPGAHLARD